MSTERKLGIAVVILLGLGGALYLQNRSQKREEATYTLRSTSNQLPKFGVTEAQSKEVDQVTIEQPAGDAGKGAKVVLKKDNNEWKLLEPVSAKASTANVDSILDNLKALTLNEVISDSSDTYAQYGVTDSAAVHVVFNKGADVVADLYFGQGGSRGQMVRLAGKTGVFGLKGYSSYLYTREAKQWRDMSLMKFEDAKVKSVEISNEHGAFEFTRLTDKAKKANESDKDKKGDWSAKFRKGKAGALAPIARLDSGKIDDLIRAYKDLNALDFAQGKSPVDTGLETPSATVTFILDDGAHKILKIGKTAESSNRWAAAPGSTEAFSISSYASDWVTSNVDKYQKPEDKKKDKSAAAGGPEPDLVPMNMHKPGE
jgi:hypothetical protein